MENIVAVNIKKNELRVRRAMRIRIPMRSCGESMDEKETNYDQDQNKHEWTKGEQGER